MKKESEVARSGGYKWGPAVAWALYDCGNSAFVLLVVTALFPVFFGSYHAGEMEAARSTAYIGYAAAAAGFLTAAVAPFLGRFADRGGNQKRWLAVFATLGALATMGIASVGEGQWLWALGGYFVGTFCFSAANIYYDSLLPNVSTEKNRHTVSALGFSVGYFGSVLLMIGALVFIEKWESVGLTSKSEAVRWVFVAVGAWWLAFTLPLWLRVRNSDAAQAKGDGVIRETLGNLKALLKRREAMLFLVAFFFYNDGVNTIIKMAAKIGADLGYTTGDLMKAIILVQVVGVPFALGFGWLANRYGARRLLMIGVAAYLGITLYGGLMPAGGESSMGMGPIYVLALLIGMFQGGLQSVSRSYFAGMIPAGSEATYFGLYNMIGKAASLLGPLVVGAIAIATGSSQLGLLGLVPFFVVGLAVLKLRIKN